MDDEIASPPLTNLTILQRFPAPFPMVRTKSIYSPIEPDDGERLLVMRYWPRGVKKERVSLWLRDLGPSAELIKRWKAGAFTWEAFKQEYMTEFEDEARKKAYASLKDALKEYGSVTLLCSCADEEKCHRGILKEMPGKE